MARHTSLWTSQIRGQCKRAGSYLKDFLLSPDVRPSCFLITMGPRTWSAFIGVLLCAAAPLSAPPASAEPNDDAFIAALAEEGIDVSDPTTLIARAQKVCNRFDRGQAGSVVVMKVLKETDLSPRDAGYFVGVSVAAYCPEYRGNIDGSLIWLLPGPPLM